MSLKTISQFFKMSVKNFNLNGLGKLWGVSHHQIMPGCWFCRYADRERKRERESIILYGRCVNMPYVLHKISMLMEINIVPETSPYHNLANKRHGQVKNHILYLIAKLIKTVVKVWYIHIRDSAGYNL